MRQWHRVRLKQKFLSLPKDQIVAMIETKVKHTSIGRTFWLLSIEYGLIYQVAESAYGPRLRGLVAIERVAKDEELCSREANRLLKLRNYKKPKIKIRNLG
jgi:hypothetical protein